MTKKKVYTREFKLAAIKLLESTDKTAQAIALELGVKRNQLYKWREALSDKGGAAFAGPGRRPLSQHNKTQQLERENKRLKQEVEILKKAAAYFARELE